MGVDQPECGTGRASPAKWPNTNTGTKSSENVNRWAVGCNLVVPPRNRTANFKHHLPPHAVRAIQGSHTSPLRPLSYNVNPRDGAQDILKHSLSSASSSPVLENTYPKDPRCFWGVLPALFPEKQKRRYRCPLGLPSGEEPPPGLGVWSCLVLSRA
jgi:hypothetical protein